ALDTDPPRPDYHGRRGDLRVPERLVARDDPRRDLQARQELGARPGGDDDVGGGDRPIAPPAPRPRLQDRGTPDHVDLPSLHQARQTGDELVDDLGLERLDLRPVGLARGLYTPLIGSVFGFTY